MDVAQIYLDSVVNNFQSMRKTAERAMDQLNLRELHVAPNEESNSIARIVKHMSGNMLSRWTDFLTSDGEKPSRDRDGEFEGGYSSREALHESWNVGWERLFDTISALKPDDLPRTVYIRREPHTVIGAIERQVVHLSYHVGQIVYLAKQIRSTDWETLTIQRGKSNEYLRDMNRNFGQHETM